MIAIDEWQKPPNPRKGITTQYFGEFGLPTTRRAETTQSSQGDYDFLSFQTNHYFHIRQKPPNPRKGITTQGRQV